VVYYRLGQICSDCFMVLNASTLDNRPSLLNSTGWEEFLQGVPVIVPVASTTGKGADHFWGPTLRSLGNSVMSLNRRLRTAKTNPP
jgi:hypothetical protein